MPQSAYLIANQDFFLAQLGAEVYGDLPLAGGGAAWLYRGYAGYNSLDQDGGYTLVLADDGLIVSNSPGARRSAATCAGERLSAD